MISDRPCECECEHGDSQACEGQAETTCPLCLLGVCLNCLEGDEGLHACTECWDTIHVAELPECHAPGHSHRATWMVAVSTSAPVVRLYVCPAEEAIYSAQGYKTIRLVKVEVAS